MKEIQARSELELVPVATGAHLAEQWGKTVELMQADGFEGVHRVPVPCTDTSAFGIAESIAATTQGFGRFFRGHPVDALVLLGDRFEILAVAMAAIPFQFPVIHLGGGEISEGAVDDSIRHALTKLSHYHLVISEECAARIRQMGEEPARIRVVGSPRLDFISSVDYRCRAQLRARLGISLAKETALVIFHPTTLEPEQTERQTGELLQALNDLDMEIVMFYPNVDVNSELVRRELERFAAERQDVQLFRPLELADYLSLLNEVDILVGNSSAGIVEAPSFRLPTVNIGNRQKGRDCMKNVIHVPCERQAIVAGIRQGLSPEFRETINDLKNVYGDGQASRRVADFLIETELDCRKRNCFRN